MAPEIEKDEDWAKQTKAVSGSRGWASLYQQRPTVAGGDIFKRSYIQYYVPNLEMKIRLGLGDDVVIMPRLFDKQAQSCDCTFKDTKTSDFVSGQVWGKKRADYYLLDRHNERMGIVDTMKAIEVMTAKWPLARAKYIEDKANVSAVIEMLKNKISGIVSVNPQGGKEVRAQAMAPCWEAGNVYLPHPLWKPWSDELVDELVSFPNGANDDDVDSMSQALVQMDDKGSLKERYGL